MLKVPDWRTKALLELADHLENLDERFDMRKWSCCIAGHCCKMYGVKGQERYYPDVAQQILGLNDDEAAHLFRPKDNKDKSWLKSQIGIREVDNKQAARVVRHLAITGEVDYDRCEGGVTSKD